MAHADRYKYQIYKSPEGSRYPWSMKRYLGYTDGSFDLEPSHAEATNNKQALVNSLIQYNWLHLPEHMKPVPLSLQNLNPDAEHQVIVIYDYDMNQAHVPIVSVCVESSLPEVDLLSLIPF